MVGPSSASADIENRTAGWRSSLSIFVGGLLVFEALTGLSIWLLPFSVSNQLMVLLHTLGGLVFLVPYLVYQWRHWQAYRDRPLSHYSVTGYIAFGATLLNVISGVILAWQAWFGTRISYFMDGVHIVTTVALLAFVLPHVVLLMVRSKKASFPGSAEVLTAERRWVVGSLSLAAVGFLLLLGAGFAYTPVEWDNEFPEDYAFAEDRSPFSPSLAMTETGGALDERALSGSEGCGTAGCHEEIYREWSVSAHRWSSMDPAFQVIQEVMATQNGPESTRYCGGCHDPISLFAGSKNIFTEDLSSLRGYNEGVSCLVCHSVQETDLQGNAAYEVAQPERYLFELETEGPKKAISDFLIRAYPRKHVDELSKSLFKTPEYCAACHKQFIDEEVNQVGWVQLQNQYDNWRKSKWNPEGEPDKVVECRECHMPLKDSTDPAAGDELDVYRAADDGMHRDHRFIAANAFIPELLELEGWEEHKRLTEEWLRGEREIPEIAHKWASGPAVSIEIQAPDTVSAGEEFPIRVVLESNKVGHDFPTGPLDIIQSWINVEVTDESGAVIMTSGALNEDNFIEPGAFMLKAEPVDRYGNLIDRHNLWEMVGVRYRRALFPGFSDVANYTIGCDGSIERAEGEESQGSFCRDMAVATREAGTLRVRAALDYRKIDQYLLNFVFGEDTDLSSPVIRMATDEVTVHVRPRRTQDDGPEG